ncbi:MAG TPA: DEAD/DEAH box helicase [Chondromyces sp.]|nr:DEAD/DEAH box helicase [Chondromyces sp.]
MGEFIQSLQASLYKGFIDQQYSQSGNYKPKLLVNNAKKNENVLTSIIHELENSQSFIFSVAFITESGLATLKSHFLDLKQKGIKGRILTSTFLKFNQPKVFRELMKIQNVEVRLTDLEGFHSKGYIFDHGTYYSLIVGSSNLTAHALKVNYEWNVKLTSHENGEIVHHFKNQFEEVWKDAFPLTEEWIEKYEKGYQPIINRKAIDQVADFPNQYQTNSIEDALKVVPNKMQQAALHEIQAVREEGKEKGLIISATGTGKTYLSAFDVRRFSPKRMLFIVHREQILNKAKADFKKVLGGPDKDFGILSGSSKQTDAKYIFATIQTISKAETLYQFDPKTFDYILIDEVHKAGAKSYQRVIDYFKPKFLMGMTATPERTDDFNIYELFDYNIAYEIRLQEALEEDMLCPFHYFGVTDIEYNGEMIDDAAVLSKLVTEERVNHIIEKVQYYGFSGEKVRGLMFCSRKQEAEKLSVKLNEKGFRTVALTGEHSQEERALRVSQLENGVLDYILTVDIFNEGIDIPSINQVVMLRQTQSSIIFIQQLGRGLRKHESKEFVTIIDFIGNYKNNYLIPIALSGDQSQNKDNLRRHMKDTSYIKGVSTINFEEVAKKQIFKSINKSNLTTLKVLKEAFVELKNKIGRVPYLYDFVANRSIDPVVIADKYSNYHQFLVKMREEVSLLTDYENKVLTMLSLEVLNGKRKHEIILLDLLLRQEQVGYDEYLSWLRKANCRVDKGTITSVQRIFDLSFFTKEERKNYGERPLVTLRGERYFEFNRLISNSLKINRHFMKLVSDIIETAKKKSRLYQCDQPFTLYEKYTRKDVCKLLNWDNNEQSTMYGYKTKHGTCPIFITYHKNDKIESSVNYGDEFLSQETLKWYTRSNRTLKSPEVQTIIEAERNHIDIHVFVKKDDDEGKDFYYLGKAMPNKKSVEEAKMIDKNGKELPVVRMNMMLEQPVDHRIYQHVKSENS